MESGSEAGTNSELVRLLTESNELARQNNKLLRTLHRNALIALIVKIVFWLVVLGVPLFFIGPYIERGIALFQSFTTANETGTSGIPSKPQIDQFLKQYQ